MERLPADEVLELEVTAAPYRPVVKVQPIWRWCPKLQREVVTEVASFPLPFWGRVFCCFFFICAECVI